MLSHSLGEDIFKANNNNNHNANQKPNTKQLPQTHQLKINV